MSRDAIRQRYGERVARCLNDLIEHGEAMARLVARGRNAYETDEMLRYAAESLLIRAGEGVDRIDKTGTGFVEDHPELELRRLKDARNVVAHGYDIVDPQIVWTIIEVHVPRVVAAVHEFLSSDEETTPRP